LPDFVLVACVILQVFRMPKKGWGVRSWDTIPSGAPICEYTGILTKTDEIDNVEENNYIFEIDCLQTMKGLDGRELYVDLIFVLQELTYDYGYALDSVVGPDGSVVKLPCHCGAVDCRKWLY
ncbi:hypothetical protein BHE74_00041643, partial [Ensete ventricosum]